MERTRKQSPAIIISAVIIGIGMVATLLWAATLTWLILHLLQVL